MNIRVARRIVKGIPMLEGVERVEYLRKGYSRDKKYVLWEGGERRYLLRMSGIRARGRRKAEFEILRQHRAQQIPCPEPYVFGEDEKGGVCYLLVSYIEGECAAEELGKLSRMAQFEVGVVAGGVLRRLHELRCPDENFNWYEHRKAKYRSRLEECLEHGLKFSGQEDAERYVEENEWMMRESPVMFQHDDYHPGNLIVRGGKLAGVVDFNRCDWGDPIEDFYKVPMFGAPASVPFARGQVMGYFPEGIPEGFWRRYTLFVGMNLHPAVLYGYHGSANSLRRFRELVEEIAATHDFRGGGPPVWYGV